MNNFDDRSALFHLHDTISNKFITNHARKDQFYIWIWECIEIRTLILQEIGTLFRYPGKQNKSEYS